MEDGGSVIARVDAPERVADDALAQQPLHIAAANALVDRLGEIPRNMHVLPDVGKDDRHAGILADGHLRRAGNLLVFRQQRKQVLRGRERLGLLRLMERRRHVLGQIAVRVDAQMRNRLRDGLRVYRLHASSSSKSFFSRSAAALTAFFFSPSSTSSLCASRSVRPFRTISSIRRASRLTSAAGDFSSGRRTS